MTTWEQNGLLFLNLKTKEEVIYMVWMVSWIEFGIWMDGLQDEVCSMVLRTGILDWKSLINTLELSQN